MKRLALWLYDLLGLMRVRLWRIANPPKQPQHWWEKSYWYEVTALDKDGKPIEQPFLQQRIILERLSRLWIRSPDLRFGQLLLNGFPTGIYHVEDADLIEQLERFYADAVPVEKEEK